VRRAHAKNSFTREVDRNMTSALAAIEARRLRVNWSLARLCRAASCDYMPTWRGLASGKLPDGDLDRISSALAEAERALLLELVSAR
jgi:hypothetical protein